MSTGEIKFENGSITHFLLIWTTWTVHFAVISQFAHGAKLVSSKDLKLPRVLLVSLVPMYFLAFQAVYGNLNNLF